jgi:hypothetical protein
MSCATGPGHLKFPVTVIGVVNNGVEANGTAWGPIEWSDFCVWDRNLADVSFGSLAGGDRQVIDRLLTGALHVVPEPGLFLEIKTVLVVFIMSSDRV